MAGYPTSTVLLWLLLPAYSLPPSAVFIVDVGWGHGTKVELGTVLRMCREGALEKKCQLP